MSNARIAVSWFFGLIAATACSLNPQIDPPTAGAETPGNGTGGVLVLGSGGGGAAGTVFGSGGFVGFGGTMSGAGGTPAGSGGSASAGAPNGDAAAGPDGSGANDAGMRDAGHNGKGGETDSDGGRERDARKD